LRTLRTLVGPLRHLVKPIPGRCHGAWSRNRSPTRSTG